MRSHAGQVAFPGGAQDPEDADEVAAALREAEEETGLDPAASTCSARCRRSGCRRATSSSRRCSAGGAYPVRSGPSIRPRPRRSTSSRIAELARPGQPGHDPSPVGLPRAGVPGPRPGRLGLHRRPARPAVRRRRLGAAVGRHAGRVDLPDGAGAELDARSRALSRSSRERPRRPAHRRRRHLRLLRLPAGLPRRLGGDGRAAGRRVHRRPGHAAAARRVRPGVSVSMAALLVVLACAFLGQALGGFRRRAAAQSGDLAARPGGRRAEWGGAERRGDAAHRLGAGRRGQRRSVPVLNRRSATPSVLQARRPGAAGRLRPGPVGVQLAGRLVALPALPRAVRPRADQARAGADR